MEGFESASGVTPETASTESGDAGESEDEGSDNGASSGSKGASGTRSGGHAAEALGKDAVGGKATPKAGAKAAPAEDDGTEEVKIGRNTFKLPKEAAKVVKDLERGFQEKARKAADLERKSVARDEEFKRNPRAYLQSRGVDPVEFSEMTLAEQLEVMAMSPEQKRLRELEAYKADQDKSAKELSDRQAQEAEERESSEAQTTMDKEIADAWQESGLPQDLFYVKQIAAQVLSSVKLAKQGKISRPLTSKEAASIVKGRFEESVSSIFGKLSPEQMLKVMKEENFHRLREWDVSRVTSKAPTTPKTHQNGPSKSEETQTSKHLKSKTMNEREYREWWNS